MNFKCCVCAKLVKNQDAICVECYENLCLECTEGLFVNDICNRCEAVRNGVTV
jgi:hypothetical protein